MIITWRDIATKGGPEMSPACLINIGLCLVCVFITPEYFFCVYTMEYSHHFCIDLFLLRLQCDAKHFIPAVCLGA